MKGIWSRLLAAILAGLLLVPCTAVAAPEEEVSATILFTHDLHSHLSPSPADGDGASGGFARLAALLKQQRAQAAQEGNACLTVDAGDFSMGTLFQTIYTTQAAELRCLGAMGFDAVTLGNHEFEYRSRGLAEMLRAALDSGDPLPAIVQANYTTPANHDSGYEITMAMREYGVSEYVMIEKDSVRFAVFGLMGQDAHESAPVSEMSFEPIVQAAKRVVSEIQSREDYDFIICLSHSGTSPDARHSEDEQLARQVDGIDLIVSGHTHSTMEEPKVINHTVIGCVGAYGSRLGRITLSKGAGGEVSVKDYALIPVDQTIPEDPAMKAKVQGFQDLVEQEYLSQFGMRFDQVLAHTNFSFTRLSQFALEQEEDSLGNLVADAYRYAAEELESSDGTPVAMALVNSGLIRSTFRAGDITVSDAFQVSSIGSGADGTPGYPLIDVYLTGRELKDIFEVDASIGPAVPGAQLYTSGAAYQFNLHRPLFNRTTDASLLLAEGSRVPIEDRQLYRVVTNLYLSQMLGLVTERSFGLLRIEPKDAQGNPITDYEARILRRPDGSELKEWYALAQYLSSFPEEDGVPQVPNRYERPEGRKIRSESRSPVALFRQPRWTTVLLLVVITAVIVAAGLLIWHFSSWRRRRIYGKQNRGRSFYRRYRG